MNKNEIKNAGLKVTTPRLKILKILETAKEGHLTAEEVYKRLCDHHETIGLATVYRVLTQFEAADLVIRHHFEGGHSVFELAKETHHDHLVCVACSRVQEFVDSTIEARQQLVAQKYHFTLTDHAMVLYGFCARCKKEE
ncbi:MAG: ferric iron uptake transcriptional regulator [Gammaproteobacteria bacterium]|nr:ferric iron uptake transcriptional regulator [Gammaproteobacteria bacterium]